MKTRRLSSRDLNATKNIYIFCDNLQHKLLTTKVLYFWYFKTFFNCTKLLVCNAFSSCSNCQTCLLLSFSFTMYSYRSNHFLFHVVQNNPHQHDFLAHFWPMFPFYTPWKHQKTNDFLIFSDGIKWEDWPIVIHEKLFSLSILKALLISHWNNCDTICWECFFESYN